MGIWEDLLIGEGFWFGLLLQHSLLFVITNVNKLFGFLAGCYSIILFIYYLENLASTNNYNTWGMIFCGVCAIFYFIIAVND